MADGGVEGGGLLELYWSSGGPKGSGDFGSCGQWELWQWPQSSSDPRGVACGILAKAEALAQAGSAAAWAVWQGARAMAVWQLVGTECLTVCIPAVGRELNRTRNNAKAYNGV